MKQRLIAALVVFLVGFGVGLGATYMLLSKKPTAPEGGEEAVAAAEDEEAGEESPVAGADAAGGPSAPVVAVKPKGAPPAPVEPTPAEPQPGALAEPSPTQPGEAIAEEPGAEPTPGEPAIPAPGAGEPTGTEPGAGEPVVAEPAAIEPSGVEPVAAEPAALEPAPGEPAAIAPPGGAQDPKAAPANWWEGLAGKKCKVDLGRVKVLTIRAGDLKDGDVVEWKSKFGNRPAVGRLFQEQETIAEIHGVATDSVGNPVAAKISVDRQGRTVTGVIALHTQGLRVSLHPVP